ncbi:unnamed protein product [Clonostachys rosea f. rosea IK726]|uniref:Uncharacterized protein n=1 Tax=Clonostachys rosea f. rosea IK726 TaxID=1349383 RepID=A0ACA9UPT9_BIOOC|nr:unnamed protein product [Clonostachys rosea f. rosea IK726]
MANEFGGLSLECIGSQLVPNGDGYSTITNRAYTVAGAGPDVFSFAHLAQLWNLDRMVVAFTLVTAIALERSNGHDSSKSSLEFKRGKDAKTL